MFLKKLGKRGAEMVEYAIVLACIAAVGVTFYSSNDSNLTKVLDGLFGKVTAVVDLALGNTSNTKINRAPLKPGYYPEGLQDAVNAAVDGIYDAYKKSGYALRTLKIDNNGKLKEITYWTGDETFEILDSTQYLTRDCNSYLDGTGFIFNKDTPTGNNATCLFYNQNGNLVMPPGYNQQQASTNFWPRLVISKDDQRYVISTKTWGTNNDYAVSKDNAESYLDVYRSY